MYDNLAISMIQFREDKKYNDFYQLFAEINGITVESYTVHTLDRWAEILKCSLYDVKTRVIKK